MRLQVRRVDHDRLVLGTLGGQAHHDPGEDPFVAPALPTALKGLCRAVVLWCVAAAQPIAIDENYGAEDASIIDAGLAMALGKERLEPLHLSVRQPVNIVHRSGLLAEPESL